MWTVPKATLVFSDIASLCWALDRHCPYCLLLHCPVQSPICRSLVSQDHMDRTAGIVEVDMPPSL